MPCYPNSDTPLKILKNYLEIKKLVEKNSAKYTYTDTLSYHNDFNVLVIKQKLE